MSTRMDARALIAEDEPLLAASLRAALGRAWPALQIVAQVGDGASAVQRALDLHPGVLFLDIRMPGMTGLEAAAELAETWPEGGPPFPVLVFVTAYDEYAVQAFEAQAIDYLIKPVVPERLARTVQRIQQRLAERRQGATGHDSAVVDEPTLERLRALLSAPAVPALKVIQASVGNAVRLVPVDEVLVFEAADKYVRVLTGDAELLIRTPLKDLLPQLDPEVFWQVHRGTVVRATAIHSVHRDEAGRFSLELRGRPGRVPVSRLYAGRFKAM